MATGISNLTESTFSEEVAGSDVPVLVDFWAEWCNPCKLVAPILEEINGENDGKLKVRVGAETEIFERPRGKDIDTQQVVDLRRMLRNAGFEPQAPGKEV